MEVETKGVSKLKRVVVTDCNFPSLAYEEAAAAAEGAEFVAQRVANPDELPSFIEGADIVLVQLAPIAGTTLSCLEPGSVLIRYGVGYDNIDIPAAVARGLKVAYVPDYCANEVAEHSAATLLSLLRKLPRLDSGCRTGLWNSAEQAAPILPFDQTTIGLLGLGRIGRELVARLKGFGFRMIAYDPFLSAGSAENLAVQLVDKDTLVRESDAISLHAPLTTETRHVVDADFLNMMRPDAVLVNAARGGLVDADALTTALNAGQIAAAALDVFETEPLPTGHPLWSARNLMITPHAAWYSTAALDRLQKLAAEELGRALRGEPLRCPVPTS